MNRRRFWFTRGMAVLMLGSIANIAVYAEEAKSRQANWDNLKGLATGDDIRLVLNDTKSYKAKFQSVSDETIAVRLVTGEETFPRESVLRVSTKGKSHRGRNALIGLAVGAGAGVVVGVASPELGQGKCAQGSCVNAESAALAGFVGAVVGTGLGAVLPTGGWHDVYRAR